MTPNKSSNNSDVSSEIIIEQQTELQNSRNEPFHSTINFTLSLCFIFIFAMWGLYVVYRIYSKRKLKEIVDEEKCGELDEIEAEIMEIRHPGSEDVMNPGGSLRVMSPGKIYSSNYNENQNKTSSVWNSDDFYGVAPEHHVATTMMSNDRDLSISYDGERNRTESIGLYLSCEGVDSNETNNTSNLYNSSINSINKPYRIVRTRSRNLSSIESLCEEIPIEEPGRKICEGESYENLRISVIISSQEEGEI